MSTSEFDLATACNQFGKTDILCFIQRNTNRSRELQRILDQYRPSFKEYEFDDARDLLKVLEKGVRDWLKENIANPEEGAVLSVQVECRDRFGVLACLTERLFKKGGNILRAEHRNHLEHSYIRIIASWLSPERPDPASLKVELEQALGGLFGVGMEEGRVIVAPVAGENGTVETRGVYRVLFWDGRGVAERIFGVLADAQLSIVESRLTTIPASPALGRIELMVNAGGSLDTRLGLIQNRLQDEPNVLLVERSTERGKWWY